MTRCPDASGELTPIPLGESLPSGPGPTNVDPAALRAMNEPMLGHLDPELHELLLDLVEMLRRVYRAEDGLVLPLQATGTSGMEAGLANLAELGDTVIVGVNGYFGGRVAGIAPRFGGAGVGGGAGLAEHTPHALL